ncbi:unnamed protein product [Thlaspi arvense]|uniref:SFR19-like C-terminal domain-containing protein n=1 Tax=Thlaspi arvense TaxID=13288 RepID=A0AAU9SJ49_THLAR|nr:unnamed protein product [Thlaspi arvense]
MSFINPLSMRCSDVDSVTLQQNHAVTRPPPPGQTQLTTMSGTTQSYTNLYPSSQGETQTARGISQQFHCHLPPPVSMLPPPPLLPPGTLPLMQALPHPFHPLPSFPLSAPARSLEPPGMMPLPPPPPGKPQAAKHVCENGVALEDAKSLTESSNHCDESSPPHEIASPSCSDPDIEMEDDITLPEDENYTSQPLNCGSHQVPGAYLNTEQPLPETDSITGVAMNFQTELLPLSKPYAQMHQDTDDGSRQASSSPYSGRAKIVPERVLGDMYDPFVDSFEPASVKVEHEPVHYSYTEPKASISSNRPVNMEENNLGVDKQALSESDVTGRVSVSSNKPPDVEENITVDGAVVSGDDDEFGENAENGREGNSHETGTPDSHDENPKANNNVCEGDSTRKKSRGDPKEKDSSRSMKLFKVVLTKFVKDLLKPSWRQGNMSKEAFKTIVKRAVDKVSNSMEGRRVPKSRAKIDKYIGTSQHKLTKLVMGYVDKYVKA